ncbi:hypothetical protein Poli38472_009738 [Pythium oligandrum]|uniref:Uncharacterized protein n=1 Tax=Pythium oligandrum TaxID=41045 RepID=A0A8K1CFG8_PYTOL|nr:hypothetical protein Poli38472_009738 [Pythium oligandrum]|eukprot:TMW62245.1 hypothetical protein Poli38472_009738 [Pythium oligandrum]
MTYQQTRFLPFEGGAPHLHTLQADEKQTQVLVTTDRSVHVLRFEQHDYHVHDVCFLDGDDGRAEVITSGLIQCPGRERIAVAYAEPRDDEGEDGTGADGDTGDASEKLFLSVVDSAAIGAERLRVLRTGQKKPASGEAAPIQFELVAVPSKIASFHGRGVVGDGVSAVFHGVILFRADSMVAFGFVDEKDAAPSDQCIRLPNEQFAAFFPEFAQFNHPVLSVDMLTGPQGDQGWIAFGCADGFIRVFHGTIVEGCLGGPYQVRDFQLNGPVTAVSLFTTTSEKRVVSNLVATCGIGQGVVLEDLSGNSTPRREVLPGSTAFDSIFSAVVADIELDGEPELLLGTDDQQLLAYKRRREPETPQDVAAADPSPEKAVDALSNARGSDKAGGSTTCRWDLLPQNKCNVRAFGGIYSLDWIDLNGDGLNELIVASSTGVYVYEADPALVLKRVQKMLSALGVKTDQ